MKQRERMFGGTFEAVIIFVSTVTTATVPSADADAKCPTHRERPKL